MSKYNDIIPIRINAQQKKIVKKACKKDNITVSELVRKLLNRFILNLNRKGG
jgi:antitoxin component of RelBE/YafQ-DinJ toxin-antitoxin module